CANIEVKRNDRLPKYICAQCKEGLESAYRLRKMGEATTKRLQTKLSKSNANKKLNAKASKKPKMNLRRSSRLKDSDKDSKVFEEILDIEEEENIIEYSDVEEDCEELQNCQELEEEDIYEDSEKFEEDEYIPVNVDNSEYDPLNLEITTNSKESNETKSEKPKKPRMKFPKWD
uniref:ZAD domain-containing protein n=1 Tax=Megaselia scalaris TaxID=36166 RepID=T1GZX1_MEGSC